MYAKKALSTNFQEWFLFPSQVFLNLWSNVRWGAPVRILLKSNDTTALEKHLNLVRKGFLNKCQLCYKIHPERIRFVFHSKQPPRVCWRASCPTKANNILNSIFKSEANTWVIANADSAVSSDKQRNWKRGKAFSQRFYLLGVGLDHDVAVDEDGADDGTREQRMCEHVDGDPGDDEHDVLNWIGWVGWI